MIFADSAEPCCSGLSVILRRVLTCNDVPAMRLKTGATMTVMLLQVPCARVHPAELCGRVADAAASRSHADPSVLETQAAVPQVSLIISFPAQNNDLKNTKILARPCPCCHIPHSDRLTERLAPRLPPNAVILTFVMCGCPPSSKYHAQ